ncbi:hypothetical protein [Streptomyces sp. UNOC14_S4]|uniref:hypothetical protein n=1 Tax=Streptomyces sp. UNOC14_S4 TaxID=2872340 RepID=UPI001E5EE1EF|nr:hypothetical protein [Streptomyces sp. UNOC14_S4]
MASLAAARAELDPDTTVVHLCTPPDSRAGTLLELAELGFRFFLLEKPMGTGSAVVEELRGIRDAYGLRLAVVAPWLHSTLTLRLVELVDAGELGELRSITVRQFKPRLTRTFATPSHPTAFDVEPPHSVGVALRLAGPGRVTGASWTDARTGRRVVRHMGSARLTIEHDGGVGTTITSDLTSPINERSIRLEFAAGTVTGHYPTSGMDSYAQLRTDVPGVGAGRELFHDEALTACVLQVYRDFATGADRRSDFELQAQVVALLTSAKDLCLAESQSPLSLRQEEVHHAG